MSSYRIGADIGGTFTDVVLSADDETFHYCKVSSTPKDYSLGILNGIAELLERVGGKPGEVTEIIHATTVATNAVLEGKGARTALVTTRGFRDVVEIGRLRIPELYNLNYRKPVPLAPRRRRYEVSERLTARGEVLCAVDEAEVAGIAERIAEDGAEAVAISFLHSYVDGSHERQVFDLLKQRLSPDTYISMSCEVLPEIREYERTSTVVVNAYLGPVVRDYLSSLKARLLEAGISAPLSIMQSSGGVINADTAIAIPASVIESGPAAGVIAAANVGKAVGYTEIITLDMGGTTAKAAMIEAGEPAHTTEYEVGAGINLSSKLVKGGGHAVKMPFIDVSEIGAGGGSIVRLDDGGLMRVGPDSAGSWPGPACYGNGGQDPTFTDAAVLLGYLNPHYIAGGAVRLDAELSAAALSKRIAVPAGMQPARAAHGVYTIAAATMMRAVKAVSTYRGRDPREFDLFAFGGNGPVIAVEIARLLEMRRVVIPPSPGVFSASGLLFSTKRRDLLKTLYADFEALSAEDVETAALALGDLAGKALVADGCAPEDVELSHIADIRYSGQAYELSIPVAEPAAIRFDRLKSDFHAEHERTYGYCSPEDGLELVNLRVVAQRRPSASRTYRAPRVSVPAERAGSRRAWFGAEFEYVDTAVIERGHLLEGARKGPVIVEEYDATTVVPPGWAARLDAQSNIIIEKDH